MSLPCALYHKLSHYRRFALTFAAGRTVERHGGEFDEAGVVLEEGGAELGLLELGRHEGAGLHQAVVAGGSGKEFYCLKLL